MMDRRAFISLMGGSIFAVAQGQQAGKAHHIGFLPAGEGPAPPTAARGVASRLARTGICGGQDDRHHGALAEDSERASPAGSSGLDRRRRRGARHVGPPRDDRAALAHPLGGPRVVRTRLKAARPSSGAGPGLTRPGRSPIVSIIRASALARAGQAPECTIPRREHLHAALSGCAPQGRGHHD